MLSISKEQQREINYGTRVIKVYPDTSDEIISAINTSGLMLKNQFETEFAEIFVAVKGTTI